VILAHGLLLFLPPRLGNDGARTSHTGRIFTRFSAPSPCRAAVWPNRDRRSSASASAAARREACDDRLRRRLFDGDLESLCDLGPVVVLNGGAEAKDSLQVRRVAPGDLPGQLVDRHAGGKRVLQAKGHLCTVGGDTDQLQIRGASCRTLDFQIQRRRDAVNGDLGTGHYEPFSTAIIVCDCHAEAIHLNRLQLFGFLTSHKDSFRYKLTATRHR
jgi:hypothetical protein